MIRLQKDLRNKEKNEKKGQMIGQVTYSILDHSEYKYKFAIGFTLTRWRGIRKVRMISGLRIKLSSQRKSSVKNYDANIYVSNI